VFYVTERAVFRLCDEGLELLEIAPGMDIENDILAHMSFRPIIRHMKLMPTHCFSRSVSSTQSGFRH
jgi:propionate CoA-transferase